MPRRFFRRVSGGYLKKQQPWFLRPFQAILAHPAFFAVTRRSVVGALWLGLFIGLLPLPAQTLTALLIALVMRVNLPIAGLSVWVTNPVTVFPIFYWEYRLGTFILDIPKKPFSIDLSWEWFTTGLVTYWKPMMLGSLITATVLSSAVYVAVSVTWRWVVANRFRRRHRRDN